MKTKYHAVCPVCKVNIEFKESEDGAYWRCTRCASEYPNKEYLLGFGQIQEEELELWQEAFRACRLFSDRDRCNIQLATGFKAGWDAALQLRHEKAH